MHNLTFPLFFSAQISFGFGKRIGECGSMHSWIGWRHICRDIRRQRSGQKLKSSRTRSVLPKQVKAQVEEQPKFSPNLRGRREQIPVWTTTILAERMRASSGRGVACFKSKTGSSETSFEEKLPLTSVKRISVK